MKHIKSIRLNPNIFKYCEFWELMVLGLDTKSDMTSEHVTNFFIIIRHYKWEDCEINAYRLDPSHPRAPPQKSVPITLVGIPYLRLIYTLVPSTLYSNKFLSFDKKSWTSHRLNSRFDFVISFIMRAVVDFVNAIPKFKQTTSIMFDFSNFLIYCCDALIREML